MTNKLDTQDFNANPDITQTTTPERFDTLVFHEDGTVKSDNYVSDEVSILKHLGGVVGRKSEHTIQDFLKRPVVMKQGLWGATAVEGTELWSANFPGDLLAFAQNTAKVTGFVGMRARVRVRVQMNSQPFQQGMAVLSFLPYSQYMPQHTAWFYKSLPVSAPTGADMVAVCGLPHTILNLANQTAVEFITPYISPYIYVNLVTGQGSFGRVTLNAMTPIGSNSATNVSFTVWANFEDVELVWPTDAPVSTNWAQVGGELSAMERTGVISSTISSIGSAASSILPMVGLQSLAKPVSLFSTAASNIFKLFGFSKPSVQAPVTRVLQAPARYFLNYDGSDTGHKLGFSAGNELQTFSGFAGTDNDEMSLSYIAARPTYIDSFEWSTNDNEDKQLWSKPLTPFALGIKGAATNTDKAVVDRLSPAARLATFFAMWRGDFVFDFHFVKTQNHSGRIRISSRLYNYTTASTTLNDMPGFTETADIDLSAASTVRFRVPWAAVRPWLLSEIDRGISLTSGDALNYCMGQIQISVLNKLVCAPQCQTTVPVVVFAHMDNAQFAVPINPTTLPYGLPAEGVVLDGSAQVGGVEKSQEVSEDQKSLRGVNIPPGSMCTGELVTSARQLIKRFTPIAVGTFTALPPTGSSTGASGNSYVLRPWKPSTVPTGTISPTLPNYSYTDFFSHLAPMFAFARGSMRFKLVLTEFPDKFDPSIPFTVTINNSTLNKTASNPVGISSDAIFTPIRDTPNTTPPLSKVFVVGFGGAGIPVYLDKESTVEFEVPYYSTGHMVASYYGTDSLANHRGSITPLPYVTISHPQMVGGSYTLYRACGDDFSFGGLLGSPQVAEFNYPN